MSKKCSCSKHPAKVEFINETALLVCSECKRIIAKTQGW